MLFPLNQVGNSVQPPQSLPGSFPCPAPDKTSLPLPGRVSEKGPGQDERDFPADLLTPHYLHLLSRTQTDIFPMLGGSEPSLRSRSNSRNVPGDRQGLRRAEGEEETWAPSGPPSATKIVFITQRFFSHAKTLQKDTCSAGAGWGGAVTPSLGCHCILCHSLPAPFPGTGWVAQTLLQKRICSCLCTGMIRVFVVQGDGKAPGATGGHGPGATPGHATCAGDRPWGHRCGGDIAAEGPSGRDLQGLGRPLRCARRGWAGVPTSTPVRPSFPSCSAKGFACKQQPPGSTFNPSPLGYYSSPANLKASPFFCARHPQSRGNSSALT